MVMKRRYRTALSVLQRGAKVNGVTLPDDLAERTKADDQGQEDDRRIYGVWDMFRTPILRKRSLVMFYIW